MASPFFGAFHALAVDNCGRWTGLAAGLFTTSHIELVMDAIDRAVPFPARQIVVQGAARRQILGDSAPLATSAQNIQDAIEDFTLINVTRVAAVFGRWNQRRNQRPFGVGEVAWIAQMIPVVAVAVLVGPHEDTPANRCRR